MKENNQQKIVNENPDKREEERPDVVVPGQEQLSYGSFSKLARILIDIARTSSRVKEDQESGSNEDN